MTSSQKLSEKQGFHHGWEEEPDESLPSAEPSVPLVTGKSCFGGCLSRNSSCSREDEGTLTDV